MGKLNKNNLKWHQTIEVKEVNSVSPSQLSEDSPEEEESRESALLSMTRPELSSELSWRTLSEIPFATPSTPRERPSPPSMSYMLFRDKEEPFTVSEDERMFDFKLIVE